MPNIAFPFGFPGLGGGGNSSANRGGRLAKTGQTTQYNSKADDGYYQKGLVRSFTVLASGQYSGTTNIDLAHLTASTIAFAATTPGTITDSGNGLAIFKTGDVIVVSGAGAGADAGVYHVSTGNVAGTIRTTEATTLQAAGASVTIAKREAHTNACVLDGNTSLMWSQVVSASMGATSTGELPWYDATKIYDIFTYVAAANAASLAGYTDWRIPNAHEIFSLQDMSGGTPDVAFAGWGDTVLWSSNTVYYDATLGFAFRFANGLDSQQLKTSAQFVLLVRGG